MAYKFQLGTARLSGSLVQEGQIKAHESKLSASTIGLGDASGLAETGGGIEASGGKLELSIMGMQTVAYDVSQDAIFFAAHGNAGGNIRSGSFADLATAMAGNGIGASSGVLSVDTNGSSINNGVSGISVNVVGLAGTGLTENSGQLDVSAAQTGITSIINSSIGKIGTATNQEYIDFGTSNEIKMSVNNSAQLTVGDGNVIISGDLIVQGSSVEIQQGFVVTSSVAFEGTSPDAHEVILTAADATDSDKTITLPNVSGHVPLITGSISNANVTAAEFALLDGGTARTTATVIDGDGVLFNDGGVMKHINVTSLKTYFQTGVTADSASKIRRSVESTSAGDMEIDQDGGVNYFAITASATAVIDPGFSAGQELNIKAGPLVSEAIVLTVSGAAGAGYTFDGFPSIQLESPNASIKLILRNANDWMIF